MRHRLHGDNWRPSLRSIVRGQRRRRVANFARTQAQPSTVESDGAEPLAAPAMRSLGPPSSSRNGDTPPAQQPTVPAGPAASARVRPGGTTLFSRGQQTDVVVKESAAPFAGVPRELQEVREVGVLTEGSADIGVGYAQFAWAQEDYNERLRGAQIWALFITVRAGLASLDQKWTYLGGYTDEKKSARARRLAVFLRESILQLGPTFIKVGQLISTRNDLLGPEFVTELSKLQDRVPAFSSNRALQTIETELGKPVIRLFKSFEQRPIAAASLGQVHRATLWDDKDVVVKVQRPGLKRLFDIDLRSLKQIAEVLDRINDKNDVTAIYEECADVLYKEIDYLQEGRNAARFKRNFRGTDWVKVPSVEWGLTSPRVLTLEYLPGVKITDAARMRSGSINGKLVAQRATEAYLMQILYALEPATKHCCHSSMHHLKFEIALLFSRHRKLPLLRSPWTQELRKHGFFHADPHPGNFALDRDNRLIFYDFGMMGEIVPNIKQSLLEVFYGVYEKDSLRVVDALIGLGVIKLTGGDRLSLQRSLAYFIENITRQTKRGETVGAIGEDLFAIALDEPFRFPATFTFVLRAFTTLEGIGKTLDPDYNFTKVATPYAQELLELNSASARNSFVLQQVQQQAADLTQAAAQAPSRIQYLESTVRRMEEGDLKLRVRVLESERAARRQGVLQAATLNTIALFGFLQLGTTFALSDHQSSAVFLFILSSISAGLLIRKMQRVKRLDKFEKDLRK